MKGLFPQFAHSPSQDYGTLWKQALFVFDSNVLLNLYRYQSATRDELLNVLARLSDRVWVPHHVALEFQRNRINVIAEQNKRFSDVRRTIEKAKSGLVADLEKLQLNKRHSLINPQPLTSGFEKLAGEFLADLERLQANQQTLGAPDPLKEKIESLFENRVGKPPGSQREIDEQYKCAEARYKSKIPPGYQDADKDKAEPDEHIQGGIIYKRKYGDFVAWMQLLAHAKASGAKSVVLVTDDGKEDWWWRVDSDGPKIVGPRPELVEEARLEAGVDNFLMYSPESFLKYAKEFLKAPVSEETLKEVRDISTTRSLRDIGFREFRDLAQRAEQSVYLWLEGRFERVQANSTGFPDFIAQRDGKSYGFEVKVVQAPRMIMHRYREVVYRAYFELHQERFAELTIVWVAGNQADAEDLKRALARTREEQMPSTLRMVIGSVEGGVFSPYAEFLYNQENLTSG